MESPPILLFSRSSVSNSDGTGGQETQYENTRDTFGGRDFGNPWVSVLHMLPMTCPDRLGLQSSISVHCLANWVTLGTLLAPTALPVARSGVYLLALICWVNRVSQIKYPMKDLMQVMSVINIFPLLPSLPVWGVGQMFGVRLLHREVEC